MVSFSQFSWGATQGSFAGGGTGPVTPRNVYVSSSIGSDANDGLTPLTPKATLAAGKALMRQGAEDALLLLWNDEWTEALGNWTTSGRSAIRPQRIGSYGLSLTGARPKVKSGISDGLRFSVPVQFVRVEDVRISAHSYNGSAGTPAAVRIAETASDITITGCYLENCADGVRIDPPVVALHVAQRITIYRNVIADIYASVGNPATGVYCARTFNSSINDNVFSKIGEVDPGVNHHGILVRSGSSYNCSGVETDGNLFLEVAGCAVLNRSSNFEANNNMISRAAIAFGMFGLDPVGGWADGLADVHSERNCITEGRDTNGSTPRGWGYAFEHCGGATSTSVNWHNNCLVDSGASTDPHPFIVYPAWPTTNGTRMQRLWTNGNRIYEWLGSCKINESATADPFRTHSFDQAKVYSTGSHYVFEHNLDNGSRWNVGACHLLSGAASGARYRYNGSNETQAAWKAHLGNAGGGDDEVVGAGDFPDATRSIATYDTVVGGSGTFASFVTQARAQSLRNWRPELGGAAVALWISEGYGF